ncbi:hypothetical protein DFJ73DRAFT_492102 [Zopfochytrium polystomum]|nr:hypothetical protein DFJ73DRAFT_492102 [Zopfochytrium polystomum]
MPATASATTTTQRRSRQWWSATPLLAVLFASILLAASSTPAWAVDPVPMNQVQQKSWDTLRNYALDIDDELCSNDVVATLDEANFILVKYGLGDDFLNALFSVRDVSGDIPQSSMFKTQLISAWDAFADSVGYVGQTLGNGTRGGFVAHGVSKPKLHLGHKAPVQGDAAQNTSSTNTNNTVAQKIGKKAVVAAASPSSQALVSVACLGAFLGLFFIL